MLTYMLLIRGILILESHVLCPAILLLLWSVFDGVYIFISNCTFDPFQTDRNNKCGRFGWDDILIFGRCTKSFQWMSKHLFAYWSISYPTFKLTIFPLTHHCLWHAHKRKLDGIYLRHFEFSGCFVSYTFKFECLYFKEVDNNRCELSCPGQSTW